MLQIAKSGLIAFLGLILSCSIAGAQNEIQGVYPRNPLATGNALYVSGMGITRYSKDTFDKVRPVVFAGPGVRQRPVHGVFGVVYYPGGGWDPLSRII